MSISNFDGNIEAGFQFASFQGPLCSEPVEGMAYFVETVEVDQDALQREIGRSCAMMISHNADVFHDLENKIEFLRSRAQ